MNHRKAEGMMSTTTCTILLCLLMVDPAFSQPPVLRQFGTTNAATVLSNITHSISGRSGNTLIVDSVNGDDATASRGFESKPFLTLSAANTAATSGDTVWVRAGSNFVATPVILKAGITVRGDGKGSLLAAPTLVSNAVLVVTNSSITISDLTIASETAAIGWWGASAVISTNIVIRNINALGGFYGISWNYGEGGMYGAPVNHTVQADIQDCYLSATNDSGAMGVHVFLTATGFIRMFNCQVYGHTDSVLANGVGVVQIFGGNYIGTVIDSITSGGSAVYVIGAKSRSPGEDLFEDGGSLEECGADYITSSGNITHCSKLYSGTFSGTLTGVNSSLTNTGAFKVSTNNYVIGTRYTNSNQRAWASASFQLSAAAAGTAKVTMYVEQAGVNTNRLSISAGPLASLITVEPLGLPIGPNARYYFNDETSGAGASVAIVTLTSSWVGM